MFQTEQENLQRKTQIGDNLRQIAASIKFELRRNEFFTYDYLISRKMSLKM